MRHNFNEDAYLAAFLTFHNALPATLSSNLPDALYNAVAFQQANPVPVATVEYMRALLDTFASGAGPYNMSITAVDHVAPAVLAQLVGVPEVWHG